MIWLEKENGQPLMPWNLRHKPLDKSIRVGMGALPPHYRPASNEDVPAGRRCGNCVFFEDGFCTLYAAACDPDFYCDSWQGNESLTDEVSIRQGN